MEAEDSRTGASGPFAVTSREIIRCCICSARLTEGDSFPLHYIVGEGKERVMWFCRAHWHAAQLAIAVGQEEGTLVVSERQYGPPADIRQREG